MQVYFYEANCLVCRVTAVLATHRTIWIACKIAKKNFPDRPELFGCDCLSEFDMISTSLKVYNLFKQDWNILLQVIACTPRIVFICKVGPLVTRGETIVASVIIDLLKQRDSASNKSRSPLLRTRCDAAGAVCMTRLARFLTQGHCNVDSSYFAHQLPIWVGCR